MNLQILASSGAFIGRYNGRNHKIFLSEADKIASDGFEFMMYDSYYGKIEEIISDFREKSLNVPTFHADKFIGQKIGVGGEENRREAFSLFDKNCEAARKVGAKKVILHLWNGPISDDNIENNLCALGELMKISYSYGVLLATENVVCRTGSPIEYIRLLADRYPDSLFTFDTKMAAFHDELESSLSGEYLSLWREKRIAHLHINDYNGSYKDWDNLKTRHIGEGKIDFDKFFQFLSSVGYEGTATLECSSMDETGKIYPEKMSESIMKIRRLSEKYKDGGKSDEPSF